MDTSKFSGFSRRDLVYSCVNGHDILATVLTPKELQDQPPCQYPVLVHWHGGGFVLGHRMYAPWWPDWSATSLPRQRNSAPVNQRYRSLQFAQSQSALIISPDYRLLPEANGSDILADVDEFSNWMRDELPSIADRESWHASPDLGRVACIGESGGGWLAMQSALLFSAKIDIKAVISISAPLDGSCTAKYTVPGPKVILGARPPPPREAEALIREYMRSFKPGAVRSEGDPAEMWQLLLCIFRG